MNPDWSLWQKRVHYIEHPTQVVDVAIIGKYIDNGAY